MESVILDFYIDYFTLAASKGEYGSLVCIFESLIHYLVRRIFFLHQWNRVKEWTTHHIWYAIEYEWYISKQI